MRYVSSEHTHTQTHTAFLTDARAFPSGRNPSTHTHTHIAMHIYSFLCECMKEVLSDLCEHYYMPACLSVCVWHPCGLSSICCCLLAKPKPCGGTAASANSCLRPVYPVSILLCVPFCSVECVWLPRSL